jgi:hypothetical protein
MWRSFVWGFGRDWGIGLTCVIDVQVGLANRQ